MKVYTKALLFMAMLLIVAGCKKDSEPVAPKASADVKKYVSIGNSLTAGYQSGGLYRSAQVYGYPNLIAQQLTAASATIGTFEIPYWDDPGSYGADGKSSRLVLRSLTGPVIVTEGLAPGTQSNLNLARPYDNLGIPGAIIYDFLDTTNFISKSTARANPFFGHVLRSSAFGASVLKQAKALNPDLVSFWLGNNDVLGYATSGGTSVSPFSGSATPTPSTVFASFYNAALDSLRAALPNAKLVVGNIPDVKAVPYFTTIGPKVAASLPTGVYARYQMHGNSGVAYDSSRFTETNAPYLTLTASTYAAYIGVASGRWYKDNKYPALPTGIDTTKPFGVHPQNPLPDALVLDASEQTVAQTAITAFNATIATAATRDNAALVDVNTIFNNIKANGITVGGVKYTTDFITGQLFSLDGVHPSAKGQGIVANEYIKAINSKFSFSISEVDISALPGISVTPLAKYLPNSKMVVGDSYSSWKPFLSLWQN
jgi:hypothetical protein